MRAGSVPPVPSQLTDVLPTVLEAIGAAYPTRYNGHEILPYEGRSLLGALRGGPPSDGALYWEHTGNAAMRRGQWKLVREYPRPWELYEVSRDRSEIHDVANRYTDVVRELSAEWEQWAARVGVIPWEVTVNMYLARGLTEDDASQA